MRYLFFDIECSNGRDICTFGYTITDEQFKVLEKEDIIINPESNFTIPTTEKRKDIRLAYSREEFAKAPNYPKVYEKIASIINHPDQKIFGHAVSSDIKFLKTANARYDLPQFKFDAYDTQRAFAQCGIGGGSCSLSGVARSLGYDLSKVQLHKSCDDAYLTMLCAKGICEKLNKSPEEVFNPTRKGYICNSKKIPTVMEENARKAMAVREEEEGLAF